jgi:2-polyprenyl-3-methyl-5-hydroxy-6-metoxy-1,4-benzoquinol methylase
MSEIRTKKEFDKIIDLINQKSPLQKKRLKQYLGERDDEFWHLAEEFTLFFKKFLQSEALDIDYLVSAYLKLCGDMLREQARFLQTGRYSASAQEIKNIYLNKTGMMSYMCGLALSQFLWKNHYAMFRFFNRKVLRYADRTRSYLEIGPGHGLFLVEAVRNLKCQQYEAVDISPASVELSKKITHFISEKADQIHFKEADILNYGSSSSGFDFITMGEVLEHVEEPGKLLRKVKSLLSTKGRAFITTCSNCPAVDHIYLFNDIDEIRDMIRDSGFDIEDELVLPVENLSPSEMQSYKIGYNYASILK